MSKAHNNSHALPVSASYELMYELRRGLKLHSYTYRDREGKYMVGIDLNYSTTDGKVHRVAQTEVEV